MSAEFVYTCCMSVNQNLAAMRVMQLLVRVTYTQVDVVLKGRLVLSYSICDLANCLVSICDLAKPVLINIESSATCKPCACITCFALLQLTIYKSTISKTDFDVAMNSCDRIVQEDTSQHY